VKRCVPAQRVENFPPDDRYIITSLLLYFVFMLCSYAARVAFNFNDAPVFGRSDTDDEAPTLCRARRREFAIHPFGGIASHPGRGCRRFSRSRKKSSTNEIVANNNNKLTSELGARCSA
jgi:hypothetical protein